MTDPELLLLDEPAAGLDLGGREDLVGRLATLAADPDAPASVLVTHHVEEIPPGFSHVLLLRAGRVVAAGLLDDVLTDENLSATFGLPLALARPARPVDGVAALTGRVSGAASVTEFVSLEVDGGVGTIRLDRPPMNAFNRQIQKELRACAEEAADRADVRAVVVYGGEKVFAAGADIKELAAMTYADIAPVARRLSGALRRGLGDPQARVAAVTGYALGGGCELALAADFRIFGENAKLGQPEILLGLIPGGGGTQRLPRLVGPARAKDLIFTGRMVRAAEALEIGPGRPGRAGRGGLHHGPRVGRRSSPRGPRWRSRPRRRLSTAASTPTCAPGSTSSRRCSRRCSRPPTRGSGSSLSWSTARGRRSSPAAELPQFGAIPLPARPKSSSMAPKCGTIGCPRMTETPRAWFYNALVTGARP